MPRAALTLKALGERITRPGRALRNRLCLSRARIGARNVAVAPAGASLPQAVLFGDPDRGLALLAGRWQTRGHEIAVQPGTIWQAPLPDPALEGARQSFAWLDDLAALGSRSARALAQAWVQEWIVRHGSGPGPGWQPDLAGLRAERWSGHADLLTHGLEATGTARFWQALAIHQRYLAGTWTRAGPGLPRLHGVAGLIWSGRVLPWDGQAEAIAALGVEAGTLIDAQGGVASRAPEDLAEALMLLIWTARMLEDAGLHAAPGHLAAIARAVPVLRPLRLGGGGLARFHGGGSGAPERLDQALAELRLGVQPRPRLPMGYARLSGGRVVLIMDGAAPPAGDASATAHASTLGFELNVGRAPLVVSAGPGGGFGRAWADLSRQTAAHSTVEVGGVSLARLEQQGLAARTFGARLEAGPTLVSVKQAQDGTGMWLLATHDGYVAHHGLLCERRLFVDARGIEARGEEILTVTDARARAHYDRAARTGQLDFAARFHLHPDVGVAFDEVRQVVELTLPTGEIWGFRAAGGAIELEPSIYFDPAVAAPVPSTQVVVRARVVEYLGQITWAFSRIAEAPRVVFDLPES